MAVDHGPDGIRVNCIAPGPVYTPDGLRARHERGRRAISGAAGLRPRARGHRLGHRPAPRASCCRTTPATSPARCWWWTAGSPWSGPPAHLSKLLRPTSALALLGPFCVMAGAILFLVDLATPLLNWGCPNNLKAIPRCNLRTIVRAMDESVNGEYQAGGYAQAARRRPELKRTVISHMRRLEIAETRREHANLWGSFRPG